MLFPHLMNVRGIHRSISKRYRNEIYFEAHILNRCFIINLFRFFGWVVFENGCHLSLSLYLIPYLVTHIRTKIFLWKQMHGEPLFVKSWYWLYAWNFKVPFVLQILFQSHMWLAVITRFCFNRKLKSA